MKTFAFALVCSVSLWASAPQYIHHPAPKQPIFVDAAWYGSLTQNLELPPKAGSKEQAADEQALRGYQKSRTQEQCSAAQNEARVTLTTFFGSVLPSSTTQALEPFFNDLRNDGDYFIQKMKVDYPRPRPFKYLSDIKPCVSMEVTQSYPSGHAALSELFAKVLSDLYPSKSALLEARAKEIAEHRVLSGMHHPTDIEAGRKLGALLYVEFKKSPQYQKRFAEAKWLVTRAPSAGG